MVCTDVWRDAEARQVAVHELGLRSEALGITRVEPWHSEVTDPTAPFREWRVFEDHHHPKVIWRIPEGSTA